MNLVIMGIPRSGKTTSANKIGDHLKIPVLHTDDLKDTEWSAASEKASYWFDTPGDWIIEGVMAVRALRKWLERNPDKKFGTPPKSPMIPTIFFLGYPLVPLANGQAALGKGCFTVYDGIQKDLSRRGITHSSCGQGAEHFFQQLGLLPRPEGEKGGGLIDILFEDD